MEELAFATLTELAAGLRKRAYTSVELTRLFLDRIARLDTKAHAYVAVYEESALRQAQAADLQRQSGLPCQPLHGLPIALKDICEIAGRVTTAGSAAWSDRVTAVTCTVVEHLLAAGMIVLGKNHMVEFCFGGWGVNPLMGTPRNPWDWNGPHRVPGGSSSGSAVAVAAGLAPAAIGSDTGGSVRMPASFNGLTGLKPTHGRISLYGTLPFVPTLDSLGPLTRTAEDAALIVNALAGFDARDPATCDGLNILADAMADESIRHFRVAVMRQDQYPWPVTDDVQHAIDNAVEVFRSLGCRIEYSDIPLDFEEMTRDQGLISAAEAYHVHAAYIENAGLPFGPTVRKRILKGRSIDAMSYLTALTHRQSSIIRFNEWMQSRDLLLTPTLPFTACALEDVDEESMSVLAFVRSVSYVGGCAISLPSGFSTDGLPIGMQLIAKPWQEHLLLQAGRAFQDVTDWHRRTPPDVR
ncbi:MAG TPA: amidase [Burkholderiales bacterium]|nr:amidase [Burkholderiales bacterium]